MMRDYDDASEYHAVSPSAVRDVPWTEAYYGLFGRRLDADEINAIEGVIRYAVRDLRQWETTKAVRRVAMEAGKSARRFPPSGEDLIRAIKAARAEYAARRSLGDTGAHDVNVRMQDVSVNYPCEVTVTRRESAATWQAALRDARDGYARGNIAASPAAIQHVIERVRYCASLGMPCLSHDGRPMP